MNLLKCTDWKVFFFRKPRKGNGLGGGWSQSGGTSDKEAKEKVDEEKEEKVTS